MRAISSIIAGSLLLAGCMTRTVFLCPDIPQADRPELVPIPRIPDCPAESECLTDETWDKLVERDRGRREYAEKLETAINTARRHCD